MKEIKGVRWEIINLEFDGKKIHTFEVPVPENLFGAEYCMFVDEWITAHLWWSVKGSRDEE